MKRSAVAFAAFLVVIVVLVDSGRLPGFLGMVHAIPGGDKLGHCLLMGTLAFLVNASLGGARVGIFLKGSLIVAVVVTLEEFSQLAIPQRTFSLWDLAFDYIGIVLGGWLAVKARYSQIGI